MRPSILSAAAVLSCLWLPAAAAAQTANSAPTAGGGATAPAGGNVSRTAPSGSTAVPNPGQPQVGAPTALEQHEEHKSQKDVTSVCKGC